jgi:hypothetical protein
MLLVVPNELFVTGGVVAAPPNPKLGVAVAGGGVTTVVELPNPKAGAVDAGAIGAVNVELSSGSNLGMCFP